MKKLVALLLVVAPLFSVHAEENLLADPGFETGTDNQAFHTAWEKWGNVYHEVITPRTGHWSAKLFGNFTDETNHSGLVQEVASEPGRSYRASAYLRHNSDDRLVGANKAWIRLEFRDATGEIIATEDSGSITADSAPDSYTLYATADMAAPPEAVRVRFVLLFEQGPDNASGAVFCDDALLEDVGAE